MVYFGETTVPQAEEHEKPAKCNEPKPTCRTFQMTPNRPAAADRAEDEPRWVRGRPASIKKKSVSLKSGL